ncbi:hypothetical protein [Halobaculum sp. P14]|uniref:hypothetical protein n=1 Tax=Halobaculum sp. P14 TaxID=3421638 RepID=UPI003EBDE14C
MPSTLSTRVGAAAREKPLLAASGAVAAAVLVAAAVGYVGVFDPGATAPGSAVGAALFALLGGEAVLAGLVLLRAVHGLVTYYDTGSRPSAVELVLAGAEVFVVGVGVVLGSAAAVLADGADPEVGGEILAATLGVAVALGVVLAVASAVRAAVGLSGLGDSAT